MYVGSTQNGGNPVRLIPFIFNETGFGQSYTLEFGNGYIAFYQNGAPIESSPGVRYRIPGPYLQANLSDFDYAQCADILTLTHQSDFPWELRRLAPQNWVVSPIAGGGVHPDSRSIGSPIAGPTGASGAGTPSPGFSSTYFITSINSLGEESDDSSVQGSGTQVFVINTAKPTSATPITLNWSAMTNATSYNIYILSDTNGVYGYIGTTTNVFFSDNGIIPDFSTRFPLFFNPFTLNGVDNFPSTVDFVQQRRVFGNFTGNPVGVVMSQPGDFYNFDVSFPSKDSDAIIFSVAGNEVNEIEHILELKFMLLLTAGAEVYIQGNGSGVITPSAINASVQSQYGCAPLRPLKVGDIMIFNQALGSFVRDFSFDFAIDGYRGNDISIFASHLFEGYTIVDWCYQKVPDSIIWAVRSDGMLLSCTYIREQQVLAWTHHEFENGFVENVCSIPENGEYAVYACIRRVINGSTVRYIERVSSRIWQGPAAAVVAGNANSVGDPIDASFCDCFLQYDGRNTSAITMTLTAVTPPFETGDTAYQQQLLLTSSAPYFGAPYVGNQIFLQDAEFISSQGKDGNQVRLSIQVFQDINNVIVTPSGLVPSEFQGLPITLWSRAVKTVSGLDHLVGQEVSVWADRFVVGSPLNSHYSTVYTVASDGTLTLDKPYAVIYVGLPMIQDLETLDLETYFGETMLGRRKRATGLTGYLYKTRSFYVGTENPDTNTRNTNNDKLFQLFPLRTGMGQDSYDEPPPLLTDQDYVLTTARWNKNGRLFIRNVDPVPFGLLAISPKEEDAVQGTYKRV